MPMDADAPPRTEEQAEAAVAAADPTRRGGDADTKDDGDAVADAAADEPGEARPDRPHGAGERNEVLAGAALREGVEERQELPEEPSQDALEPPEVPAPEDADVSAMWKEVEQRTAPYAASLCEQLRIVLE